MGNGQSGARAAVLALLLLPLLPLAPVGLAPLVLLQQVDGAALEAAPSGVPLDWYDDEGFVPSPKGPGCGADPMSPFPVALSAPLAGPLSSGFGWRKDPFGAGYRCHRGIDWAVPVDTPVKAAADGTVAAVVRARDSGGYGTLVRIDHGNGVETWYAHLQAPLVRAGSQVKGGQVIGLSGSTGRSTGPHLHFEVRVNGVPLDPLPLVRGGIPTYAKALRMEATAYSPGDGYTPGTITASGLPAGRGVVAVDPEIIPLGTRLYVDGYGEAVAGDTGSAIKGYRIDLGMDTVEEAKRWGRRWVTVYLLR